MKNVLVVLFAVMSALPLSADDESNLYPFNRQFDKKVVLQGIGWGMGAKGLGVRVVTPSGVKVYFDPKDRKIAGEFSKWQGKLIEVTGILRKRVKNPAPSKAQGYTSSFEYLVVEKADIRILSKVTRSLSPIASQK